MTPGEIDALFQPWVGSRGILLAISGGPDSMALLHLAARWAQNPSRPKLYAATIDHGLRPGSQAETELVAEAAAQLKIPHQTLHWQGEKPKTGIQETARQARYDLLAAHARDVGADVLMTAHHADDQAETILFRLLRGSGLAGLSGIKAESRRGEIILARPLLSLRKTQLIEICKSANQTFADDPSNRDEKYARTGLRNLLTQLEKQGLGTPDWTRLGARLARADEALTQAALEAEERAFNKDPDRKETLDFRQLAAEPQEIRIRVMARVLESAGARHPIALEKLENLCNSLQYAAKGAVSHAATLGGLRIRLTKEGRLAISKEGTRKRGLTE